MRLRSCCQIALMWGLIMMNVHAETSLLHAGTRYFIDEQGMPFLVSGHNEGLDWPPAFERIWREDETQARATLQNYFTTLRGYGVNTIRLFAEYPLKDIYLYDGQGQWQERNWQYLEWIVAEAGKQGIYVLLGPWDPFWAERGWDRSPLNASNGGPMHSIDEFYTSHEAFAFQQRYLGEMLRRLGKYKNILAWELINEIDLWWHAKPETAAAWVDRMVPWMKQTEEQLHGRAHMVAVSAGRGNPAPQWRKLIYQNPHWDFVSTHMYYPAVADPEDPLAAVRAIREGLKFQYRQLAHSPKPFLETENGPIDPFVVRSEGPIEQTLDEDVYHHIIWSHLAGGGAGQAMRWPYRWPHQLTERMHQFQRVQSEFIARTDWVGFDPLPLDDAVEYQAETQIAVPPEVVACGDRTQWVVALFWPVQSSDVMATTHRMRIKYPLEPGAYQAFAIDTWTGEVLREKTIESDGSSLELDWKGKSSSVAWSIRSVNHAAGAEDEPGVKPLTVTVTDNEGKLLPGADVKLKGEAVGYRRLRPGKQGFATQLPLGGVDVIASHPGYRPALSRVVMLGEEVNLDITLNPEGPLPEQSLYWSDDFTGSEFKGGWLPRLLQGEQAGQWSVVEGQLRIQNPEGSRWGMLSAPVPESDKRAFLVEAQLNDVRGSNALLNIYGGDGGFERFVELDCSREVFNLWATEERYQQLTAPSPWDVPVIVRVEVSAPDAEGMREVRTFAGGEPLHHVRRIPYLSGRPLHVFLYGWDATTTWDWVAVGPMPVLHE